VGPIEREEERQRRKPSILTPEILVDTELLVDI